MTPLGGYPARLNYCIFQIAFLLCLLAFPLRAMPTSSIVIDLADETHANTELGNLYEKLGLQKTETSELKIMNPNDVIIDSLGIKQSGDLYATKNIDRDIICREPYRRDMLHCCDDKGETCLIRLQLSIFKNTREYKDLNIRLLDSNDNIPRFKRQSVVVQIPETNDLSSRKTITNENFQAEDPDQGRNSIQTYRLQSTDHSLPFELDQSKKDRLALVLTRILDREVKSKYEMQLLAIDGGVPSNTGTLSITVVVQDVNDEVPVFDKKEYIAEIDENARSGHHVVTVYATDKDADENGHVEYSINPGSLGSLFKITRSSDGKGLVSVQRNLDAESLERKQEFDLYITAKDRGNPPKTAESKLTIRVNDVNDESPVIHVVYVQNDPLNSNQGLIKENTDGEDVAKIDVTDRDTGRGGEVDCRIDGGAKFLGQNFELRTLSSESIPRYNNRREFMIQSKRKFDREQEARIELMIVCNDMGIPQQTGKAVVRLRVTDMNDEKPVFELNYYSFNLPENVPRHGESRYQIGQVRAIDKDEGENAKVTYSIYRDETKHFYIDQNSGVLYAVKPFDREQLALGRNTNKAMVTFQVMAADKDPSHTTIAEVKVYITDVNDNSPIFEPVDYRFSVKENVDKRVFVGKVKATDEDSASRISYNINDNPVDIKNHFYMEKESGSLYLHKKLDRETKAHYVIKVIATDDAGRPGEKSGSTTVTVEVLDENDCVPKIIRPANNDVIKVPHNSKAGRQILTMASEDCDIEPNNYVVYSIVEGSPNGYFEMDSQSGIMIVARTFSDTMKPNYEFTLMATDKGSPSLSSTIRVSIRVIKTGNQKDDSFKGIVDGDGNSPDKTKTAIIIVLIVFFFVLLAAAFTIVCHIIRPCKRTTTTNNPQMPKPGRLNMQLYDGKQIVDSRHLGELPPEHYNLIGYQKPSTCDLRKEGNSLNTRESVTHETLRHKYAQLIAGKNSGDYQTLKMRAEGRGAKPEVHTYYQINTVPMGRTTKLTRGEADGELDTESMCSQEDCAQQRSLTGRSQPVTPAQSRKFTPFCPYAEASFV